MASPIDLSFDLESPGLPLSEDDAEKCESDPSRCIELSPNTVAVACENSVEAKKIPQTCAEFNKRFPQGAPRHALFDNQCVVSNNPFRTLSEKLPMSLQHTIKSHQVFWDAASTVASQYPETISDREYSCLYLGSGAHLSPVLTAMNLIDQNLIDSAAFTFTELNPDTAQNIFALLTQINPLLDTGFQDVDINENTVSFTYKEKPITITASIRNPGNVALEYYGIGSTSVYDYYNTDEFAAADVIVIHDIYTMMSDPTRDLMRQQEQIGDHKSRLLIEENTLEEIAPPYEYTKIHGPYGDAFDAEIGEPKLLSAIMLDLNQPIALPSHDKAGLIRFPQEMRDAFFSLINEEGIDPEQKAAVAFYMLRNLLTLSRELNKAGEYKDDMYPDVPTISQLFSQYRETFDILAQVLLETGIIETGESLEDMLVNHIDKLDERLLEVTQPRLGNPPCS